MRRYICKWEKTLKSVSAGSISFKREVQNTLVRVSVYALRNLRSKPRNGKCSWWKRSQCEWTITSFRLCSPAVPPVVSIDKVPPLNPEGNCANRPSDLMPLAKWEEEESRLYIILSNATKSYFQYSYVTRNTRRHMLICFISDDEQNCNGAAESVLFIH
ncbi:hypothetical protein AVEN_160794-1 [Araneus ventricosus]|uniref:Uncharacterized protein n=1 Tax=Araneus ventricosus TaxID=182803 RepID=A0A4Y2QBC8_ARAVE|nr:hypothetical protein AVEN_160794-1 [Araneus ventricosus]